MTAILFQFDMSGPEGPERGPQLRRLTEPMSAIAIPRPISESELDLLVQASRAVPEPTGNYLEEDYITNVLYTVLDLQMHSVAVGKALRFYKANRWSEIRSLDDLEAVLARFPNDNEGNRELAQFLWGNNHWTRAQWLRGFVRWLRENNRTDQDSLRAWAHDSNFKEHFEGQVKHLGLAAYKWLTMRLGVETVKPDVHLHRFVESAVGHPVTDDELIRALETVAQRTGRPAARLDWAIWEHQRASR